MAYLIIARQRGRRENIIFGGAIVTGTA